MRLTALKYGETEISEAMAFQNGREDVKLPISLMFFLIEVGEKKILVDVGCDTMPGFPLKKFQKPVKVLESYGVKRDEVTDIIITHAHNDHIGALHYYPSANVYLHKNELENAKSFLPDFSRLCIVENDEVTVANVEFKHIGGHSAGSGIVLVKEKDKTYVLCGDECYTRENLIHKKATGSSFCVEKSKWFVDEYAKDDYTPIIFHDHDLVADIGYKTIIG